MNKDQQITYAVAFKAAIELIAAGVAELETDDIAPEIIGLTDMLYAELAAKQGLDGGGKGKASRSSKRSTTSRKAGSSGGKRTGRGSSKKYEFASDGQHKLIEKLLDEKDHDLSMDEDGFNFDGTDYEWGGVPGDGTAQEIIDHLISLDNI